MIQATSSHSRGNILRPLVIVLLLPLIAMISAAILMGLLGIFVLWLIIVAGLVTAIVVSDLVRRSLRRHPRPGVALNSGAVGYPGG